MEDKHILCHAFQLDQANKVCSFRNRGGDVQWGAFRGLGIYLAKDIVLKPKHTKWEGNHVLPQVVLGLTSTTRQPCVGHSVLICDMAIATSPGVE